MNYRNSPACDSRRFFGELALDGSLIIVVLEKQKNCEIFIWIAFEELCTQPDILKYYNALLISDPSLVTAQHFMSISRLGENAGRSHLGENAGRSFFISVFHDQQVCSRPHRFCRMLLRNTQPHWLARYRVQASYDQIVGWGNKNLFEQKFKLIFLIDPFGEF